MAGTTFKCKICGKEFVPRNRKQKLCSDKCKHTSHLINQRKYTAKNKEEIREKQRIMYTDPEHREKIRQYQRVYQTTHRKELNAKQNLKYKENKLKEWRKTLPRRKDLLPLSALPGNERLIA